MDWFERLTGFAEGDYETTRSRLQVAQGRLHSTVNGRSYAIGRLEIASLASLRQRAAALPIGTGRLDVGTLRGDIRRLHQEPANAGALIQVASQFNLLEMVGPAVRPEDGVTRYESDRTQGPACAIAAGAATLYRNYFVPVRGHAGQAEDRQINCLDDLGMALGHGAAPLWHYRNGYVLCTSEGLDRVSRRLAASDAAERDSLRGRLKIGLHWDVEVTDGRATPGPLVSQAFCSALPLAYSRVPAASWAPFAGLVLEAAYEATLWAGALNAARGGSRRVLLTRLGGGAFGNDGRWIDAAIDRALRIVAGHDLEVLRVAH
jgi:hypothetical protein